ncbi:MAG: hypothetical protein Q8K82_16335, partial [Gemmatimonadaceae bacterium]|nr:hypothetical protein [Gemmatimonadaceae bacterium]
MNDALTPAERVGQPDCLVEMALAWLARPLVGQTTEERAAAIDEICLLVSQMRYRDPRLMDIERRRWIQRVTVRLCQQCGGMRGFDGSVELELERRMTKALLTYHNWREASAPPVTR